MATGLAAASVLGSRNVGSADDHGDDEKIASGRHNGASRRKRRVSTSPGWAGAGGEDTDQPDSSDEERSAGGIATRMCLECDAERDESICQHCGARTFTVKRPPDPMLGRVLDGRYRIESVVGRGGMSVVYQASQVAIGKVFALKMIKADFQNHVEATKRFYREARAASLLSHPHTIKVFDFGQSDQGDLYLVMEFVAGQPLSQLVDTQASLAPDRALKIVRAAAQSLAEAHAAGLAHRDLKPENIMLADVIGEPDFVKVLDFGIAKWLSADSEETSATATGVFVGTPYYASPEQARGSAEITSATDIYSLGIVLYEMLTGETPYDGTSALQVLFAHASEDRNVELPDNCDVSPGVRSLLRSMVAQDPSARPTASEIVDICGQLLADETGPVQLEAAVADRLTDSRDVSYPAAPRSRPHPWKRATVSLLLTMLVTTGVGFAIFWFLVRTPPASESPDLAAAPRAAAPASDNAPREPVAAPAIAVVPPDAAIDQCAMDSSTMMSGNMYRAKGVDAKGDHCPNPAHHKDGQHGVVECHYGSVFFLRIAGEYASCVERAEAVVDRLNDALRQIRKSGGKLVVGKDGHHAAIFAKLSDGRDRVRIVTITSTDLRAYRTRSREAGCDKPLSGHDLAHWWAALLIDHHRTMSLGKAPRETVGTAAGAALAETYRIARDICPGDSAIPMPIFADAVEQLSPQQRDELIQASYRVPCGWEPLPTHK